MDDRWAGRIAVLGVGLPADRVVGWIGDCWVERMVLTRAGVSAGSMIAKVTMKSAGWRSTGFKE